MQRACKQVDIFEYMKSKEPYINGKGEVLPWDKKYCKICGYELAEDSVCEQCGVFDFEE